MSAEPPSQKLTEEDKPGSLRHVAFCVPDLQAAEAYYVSLFRAELIGREARLKDGLWYTLPFDKSWREANAAGIKLGMVALRKAQLVLALFEDDVPRGELVAIGVDLPSDDMEEIGSRLPEDTNVLVNRSGRLEFRDVHGILWQISDGADFKTSGDVAGRWLDLGSD